MDNNQPDPAILNRLGNMPPYLDEKGNAVEEAPQQIPQEIQEEQPVEVPQEETIDETPQEEVNEEVALQNSKNPERTKEYIDKLKQENDALRAKALKEQEIPDTGFKFDMPDLPQFNQPVTNVAPPIGAYPELSQKDIQEQMKSIVDDQGYVDTGLMNETFSKLNEAARVANERAIKAENKVDAVVKRFDDEKLEVKRQLVHEKFPQLDPKRTDVPFDNRLWEATRNEMVGQQLNGEQPDFLKASEKMYNILYPNMNKQSAEKVNAMRNINAIGTKGSVTQRVDFADRDALVKATQKGTKGALAERLKQAGQ